jgi:hypothetical protein
MQYAYVLARRRRTGNQSSIKHTAGIYGTQDNAQVWMVKEVGEGCSIRGIRRRDMVGLMTVQVLLRGSYSEAGIWVGRH